MKKKQYKILTLILAIILCCFFSTIAYSAVYSTMNITGIAYARVVKDVRITDFKINSSSDVTSSYEEFSVNTISSKFNLVNTSSFIIFDVEVTNYGSSDVGILQLIGDVPTGLSYEIINYNLKDKICDDNGKCNQMAVKTFQIKFTGTPGEYEITQELDFRTYHKVTYTGITNNNYPTEVIDGGIFKVVFQEDLKRVQVLYNDREILYYASVSSGKTVTLSNITNDIEIKVKEPVAKLVSGNLNKVGSEVCIKDECFYIVSNDGSTVTMLAKYNLHVGNQVDRSLTTTPLSSATGIQDKTAKGYVMSEYPFIGTTAFSNTNSTYEGSIVEGYVNNYNSYLMAKGITPIEARLITKEELESLGCSEANMTCSDAPSWVYETSYWSGSSFDTDNVWFVISYTDFDYYSYASYDTFGVRPVIEISVDEIHVEPAAKVVSGDLDTVGSEIAIGDEHFHVISSTDDTVTMLAKYNISLDENPIQSSSAGITAFSDIDSTYSGSIVEGYVNNYKMILEADYGVDVVEARLISYDELTDSETFACVEYDYCSDKYPWIYSTSYWSGSAFNTRLVLSVDSDGYFDRSIYSEDMFFGVRPVITISKSIF